jgi:hypothetical protein
MTLFCESAVGCVHPEAQSAAFITQLNPFAFHPAIATDSAALHSRQAPSHPLRRLSNAESTSAGEPLHLR